MFKLGVYELIRRSPEAQADARFRHQVANAASGAEANIAEGFRRYGARDFARFLTYAIASLEEAVRRVQDGIDRGYFSAACCRDILRLGDEAGKVTNGLRRTLRRFSRSSATPPGQDERTKDRSTKD